MLCLEDCGVGARWKKIGIMLQLRYSDLEVIKRNQPDEEERLMAMLNQWLTSGRATKQALVATLQRVWETNTQTCIYYTPLAFYHNTIFVRNTLVEFCLIYRVELSPSTWVHRYRDVGSGIYGHALLVFKQVPLPLLLVWKCRIQQEFFAGENFHEFRVSGQFAKALRIRRPIPRPLVKGVLINLFD